MLIQTWKNGEPDKIIAICMRTDLNEIDSIFKSKYK